MGFHYGLEKRKFTEEWKKLYREYKAAGMSEEDIQAKSILIPFCKRSHASEAPPVQICPVPYPSLPAKKQALFCISPKIRLAS